MSRGNGIEILRSLKGSEYHMTSKITAHSLISGKPGAKKKDLLPKLDGKVFIIKDFTMILSNKDELVEILSQLRDTYDGYMDLNFGSGVGAKGYESSFGLIAGVTPAIDMYHSVQNLLGKRFLKLRIRTDEGGVIQRAQENAGKEKEMRKEIAGATSRFLSELRDEISTEGLPEIEDDGKERLQKLARAVALFRSGVQRDRNHTITFKPQPEIGTRLVKQLKKLTITLAVVRRKDAAGEEEYDTILRVGRDTVNSKRKGVLEALGKHRNAKTTTICDEVNLPAKTTREALEDLWALRIAVRSGENKYSWSLKPGVKQLIDDTGFFNHSSPRNGSESSEKENHVCEVCEKEMGITDKAAVTKVRMNGEEKWLCESCLKVAGYEVS